MWTCDCLTQKSNWIFKAAGVWPEPLSLTFMNRAAIIIIFHLAIIEKLKKKILISEQSQCLGVRFFSLHIFRVKFALRLLEKGAHHRNRLIVFIDNQSCTTGEIDTSQCKFMPQGCKQIRFRTLFILLYSLAVYSIYFID